MTARLGFSLRRRLSRTFRRQIPWTEARATIIAFAAAPILPAIAGSYTDRITLTYSCEFTWRFIELIPTAYTFAVILTSVFVFPASLVIQFLDLVRWWSAALSGAILAALFWHQTCDTAVQAILLAMSSGAAGGIVFWLIWSWGHPRQARLQREAALYAPPPSKEV